MREILSFVLSVSSFTVEGENREQEGKRLLTRGELSREQTDLPLLPREKRNSIIHERL
jgi:hypothetical protein